MNLLLLTEKNKLEKNLFLVDDERAEHIKCTLHGKEGDSLKVGFLNGNRGTCILISVDKKKVIVKCDDFSLPPPPESPVIPIISLSRPQSFK